MTNEKHEHTDIITVEKCPHCGATRGADGVWVSPGKEMRRLALEKSDAFAKESKRAQDGWAGMAPEKRKPRIERLHKALATKRAKKG